MEVFNQEHKTKNDETEAEVYGANWSCLVLKSEKCFLENYNFLEF